MFPKRLAGNARELPISSHTRRNASGLGREKRATKGRPKEARIDGRAVLQPHSTGEGGELQGSARSGHGTHWREGGSRHTNLSKGDIVGTQNPGHYVHGYRQNS